MKLLQVGTLNPQKNPRVSLAVLERLRAKGIDTKLTFVGDGPERVGLEKKCRRLNLESYAVFTGYVENKDLGHYYKKCDLVLMPGTRETFSTVPLEALIYAKPSIISDDSGLTEVLSEYCMFVKPTVGNVYRKILDFIKNGKKYELRGQKGRVWIKKNLTWERYAKDFLSTLEEEQVLPEVYSKSYFDIHHEHPRSDYLYSERKNRIARGIEYLEPRPREKILDLGCGNGEVSQVISDSGAFVWGVDYSIEAIALAKERRAKNADFSVSDAERLSFRDNYFDKVICLDVFEHIYPHKLEKVLLEVKRVLKPGGRFVVATSPNSFYLGPFMSIAKKLLKIKQFESEEYHVNVFNYFRLKKLFKGFKGKKSITLTNDGHFYFSSRIAMNSNIPGWVKFAAKLVDYLFENPISEKIILLSPLKIFLAHDLWAVVKLKDNG